MPNLRVVLQSKKSSTKRSQLRTAEGGPCGGRSECPHITRCPSLLSSPGDHSANPARVPVCSGLLQVLLSFISARNCSGAESLATLSGVSRAANMVVSCRSSISGHRSSSSNHTRGWPERLAPLVDYLAVWKLLPNVSRKGPADCRKRLSY